MRAEEYGSHKGVGARRCMRTNARAHTSYVHTRPQKCDSVCKHTPYRDALHVQLSQVKQASQCRLLVTGVLCHRVPVQGKFSEGARSAQAGQVIKTRDTKISRMQGYTTGPQSSCFCLSS